MFVEIIVPILIGLAVTVLMLVGFDFTQRHRLV